MSDPHDLHGLQGEQRGKNNQPGIDDGTPSVSIGEIVTPHMARFLDFLPDPTFAVDTSGRVIYWNRAMESFSRVQAGDMLGRTDYAYALQFCGAREPLLVDLVLKRDGEAEKKYRTLHCFNDTLYAEHDDAQLGVKVWVKANPIYDDHGAIVGAVETVRDNSELRLMETALEESEERYRLLADNARDVIWMRDTNFKAIYLSPSVFRLRGYTVQEAMAQGFEDMLTPESFRTAMEIFEREKLVEQTGSRHDPGWSVTMELDLVCKDGSTITAENTVNLVYDRSGGVIGIMGITRDISERKRVEEALRESEKRYRLLAENARDVIWVLDENLRYLYLSPSTQRLRGYTAEEAMRQTIDKVLTPDSYAKAVDLFTQGLKQEMKGLRHGPGWSLSLDLEMVCKDGSTVWTEVNVSIIYEEDGTPSGLLGITRDISERRRIEEELRKSEEKYRLLVDNAHEAIFIAQDWIMKFVNPKLMAFLGYSREELTASRIESFVHPQDRDTVIRYHQRRLEGEKLPETYDIRVIDRSGQVKWVEIKAALYPWEGRPAVLTFLSDITDRKQAEEELQRHRRHLEELVEERTSELVRVNESLRREIEERRMSEDRLRTREQELEEMNVALKVLLQQREHDRDAVEKDLMANINTSLRVYLDKLKTSGLQEDQMRYISEIEQHLKKIGSSFVRDLTSEYLDLTPAEIRVATLIREGKSSKEIADLLNVSLNAVLFHRNNIRNKVGLKNSKVGLSTYLQQYDQEESRTGSLAPTETH
mgnify:CR=1 FL=1